MQKKSRNTIRLLFIVLLMVILPVSLVFIQESNMLGLSSAALLAVGIILYIISIVIAFWLIRDYGREISEKKAVSNKLPDDHIVDGKDKQISININVNSGDFIDDRMSTKRMNDFNKMVKGISRESDSDNKQLNTKDTSKETKGMGRGMKKRIDGEGMK